LCWEDHEGLESDEYWGVTAEDKTTISDKIEAAGFRRDLARDMTSFCHTNKIPSRKEVAQQVLNAFKKQKVSLKIQTKTAITVGTRVFNVIEEALKAEVREKEER